MATRALVFAVLTACLAAPAPVRAAGGWYYYEKRGDERADLKQWDEAKEHYLKALSIAGDEAPRSLWDKYNRVFQMSFSETQAIRQRMRERERAAATAATAARPPATDAGEPPAVAVDGTAATTSVDGTAVATAANDGYVEILPDGTVRMRLTDYLRGDQVSRVRPNVPSRTPAGEPTAPTTTAASSGEGGPTGPKPSSFWREPLADTSGGRTTFSPDEKIGLRTVRTAADGVGGAGPEDASIVTPEYEVHGIDVRFIGSGKLVVRGKVTNKQRFSIRNARVYVRLYNETGVFRGRNWSYLSPGRQTLQAGQTKSFEVKFFGYTGTVGSYKVELVADLKG